MQWAVKVEVLESKAGSAKEEGLEDNDRTPCREPDEDNLIFSWIWEV